VGEESNAITLARLDERLGHLQSDQESTFQTLRQMGQHLQALPVIQSQQTQILTAMQDGHGRMDAMDERLNQIERVMPGLLEVRKWVIAGVLFCMTILGGAVLQLAIFGPAQDRALQEKLFQQLLQSRGSGP
jgi:histidinol phosphatase-like enzyme